MTKKTKVAILVLSTILVIILIITISQSIVSTIEIASMCKNKINEDDITIVVVGDYELSKTVEKGIGDRLVRVSSPNEYDFKENDIIVFTEQTIINHSDILADLVQENIRMMFTIGADNIETYLEEIFVDYPDELIQPTDKLRFFIVYYQDGMTISEYSFSNNFFPAEKELTVLFAITSPDNYEFVE